MRDALTAFDSIPAHPDRTAARRRLIRRILIEQARLEARACRWAWYCHQLEPNRFTIEIEARRECGT